MIFERAESVNSDEDVDDDDVEQFHSETQNFPEHLGGGQGALDGDEPVEERLGFVDVCLHGGKIVVHTVDHGGGVGDRSVQLLKGVSSKLCCKCSRRTLAEVVDCRSESSMPSTMATSPPVAE